MSRAKKEMDFQTHPDGHQMYMDNEVTYTNDGRLLDYLGNAVMMEWEDPIMKDAASLICRDGGKILNVGFGLGLIDNYIQSHNVEEHWIIESHPGVIQKMKDEGWDKKPNVTCIFDKWQNVYQDLPIFEGVYFDTWMESQEDFHKVIESILNPNGGKYLYFSGRVMSKSALETWGKYGFSLEEHITKLTHITSEQKISGGQYWPETQTEFNQKLLIYNK